MDTRILTIDMPDVGVLTFSGTGGSSVLNAIDDVTPTAGEESWDDVTGADSIPGGVGGDNMFHFSTSNLMDGVTISAAYVPSNAATVIESSMDYGIKYTGIEGLTCEVEDEAPLPCVKISVDWDPEDAGYVSDEMADASVESLKTWVQDVIVDSKVCPFTRSAEVAACVEINQCVGSVSYTHLTLPTKA